jgi:hypothetical protein
MHGKDYFNDAISWFEAKHGKENVACKIVHLDESAPHLTVFVVPLVNGKLNAKAFLIGGSNLFDQIQTDFPGGIGGHGQDRGFLPSEEVRLGYAKIALMTAERLALRKRMEALVDEIDWLKNSMGRIGFSYPTRKNNRSAKALDLVRRDQKLGMKR